MIKRLQLLILTLLISIPGFVSATHIVGGTLTYVYNGGSSYTVTLKLFRDCSPSSAQFPASVTINVVGYDGASFTPSKDITMAIGPVTAIPPTLDPCAIPPSPMPCVQQAIYTTTVNNLPPNPGGYHLYFQIVARNLSLTNVNAACNCVGESFYAYIPGTSAIWYEEFPQANGTTSDNGSTAWTTAAGATAPASASVNSNQFQTTGNNNSSQTWTSQVINISGYPSGVTLRADLFETGTMDPNDSIKVFYRLNGGPLTLFSTNGSIADDFTNAIASQSAIVGTTVQIVIKVVYDASSPTSEVYKFDNIVVAGTSFQQNSNPVFNLFPPLFLCVGQPFIFDHSATDADGDSLVYSMYTPYDGDAGVGPLDPTFPSNVATFTPIVFQPGYGTTNPLGGAGLTLNPSTGLLSGTPPTIGQFVVGILVKEYRNGVYLDQTLRDFQFNIVPCPQPPAAGAGPNITINDGCTGHLAATGFTPSTANWTSIFPGAPGAYNNYLSCTSGCMNPAVTAVGAPPAYVDFVVCGISAACNAASICDTVRVTFNPTLVVTIAPLNPTICFGQTSTTLTATGSGGTPPYSYLWNGTNPTQSISAGVGTYNVQLSDASGCPPASSFVTVTAYSVAINANAGPDQTKCKQSPLTTLNATVSGASGGIWSGGTGTYSPNNTTLTNMFYTPSAAELAAGSATLYLTTTGNGTCPPDKDTVVIFFQNFTGTLSTTTTQPSCFGGSNGTATAVMTGGTGPFTYTWNTSPAQSTATATGLPIGTYTVNVQNGIGCTMQATATITQPTPVAVSASITNVACSGGNNGSITATPSGGTPGYTYLWSPGNQTTATISAQTAGTYTVRITDSKGCQITASYTITQSSAVTATITSTAADCFGSASGTATVTASGGTAPYTYSWNPGGATSATATGLAAGNYTATITDNKGCVATKTVTVSQPTAVAASVSVTAETCNYLDNGSATVTASGGTAGYTYLWSPGGQTSASISGLASGNYTVVVTDSKGCTKSAVAAITEPAALTAGFTGQTNVSCAGGSNGSVSATASGGTPAYSYLWSPGNQTTINISGQPAGTYTVTVTDSKGCTAQNTVTLTQPSNPVSVTATATSVLCNGGNTGSVSAAVSGGTAGYTYVWTPGNQTTATISGQPAGTYTVTVKDAKGCQATASATITQPAALSVSLTGTDASCNAGSNGSATSTVTGGTAPYTYDWNPGIVATPNITGLAAGTYTLIVTDNKGCTAQNTVIISQPAALVVTMNTTNETCNNLDNGTATAVVTGGTPGYTYAWSPGGQTGSSVTGLAAGSYTVIVTDSKGCVKGKTFGITQPSSLIVAVPSQVNVSCPGGSNGSATAGIAGGTPNYTYTWSPGGATTNSISHLTAGIYTVVATDSKGCTAQATVTITEPNPIINSPVTTPASCNGSTNGSITSSASGGTGPYTYTLTPGSISGATVNNLAAGTYTITIKDSKNCVASSTATITQPSAIVITTSSINSSCGLPNGQAQASVTGGVPPYTYQWSPSGGTGSTATGLISGAYNVLVTDANGCTNSQFINVNDNLGPTATIFGVTDVTCHGGSDGSASVSVSGGTGALTYMWAPTGGTGPVATGLGPGVYTVTVTDANGCQSHATTSPPIGEPTAIDIIITTTEVNCFGGSDGTASATVSGGSPGYTYSWLPSGGNAATATGLSAGSYTLQVKDSHNCIQNRVVIITGPAAPLSVSTASTNVSCNGGSDGTATATISGGTASYTAIWMPGNINGAAISNLSTGTYTVNVTDANGCATSGSVSITQPTALVVTPSNTSSTCSNANGQASVSVSGGTPGYTYAWSPSGGTGATATGLLSGTYTVIVTDLKSCTDTVSITVNDQPAPTATVTATSNVLCNGGNTGTATVSVTGGTGTLSYSWAPSGGTGSTGVGLVSGTYTVTVTDINGCQATAVSALITEPTALNISFNTTDVNCFGGNNGAATASAGGGTPGYAYLWSPGAVSGASLNALTAGTYTVKVTDNNSCIQIASCTITEPPQLAATISSSSAVSCFGGNNGSATVSVSGGTPVYSYNWLPSGGNDTTATGLIAGSYTVNITDTHSCSTSATVTISQPAQALSATASASQSSCFGGSNGSATVTPTGGTPNYTYQWSPSGGTGQTATGLAAGSYAVLVTDANSCQTNVTVNIGQPTAVTGSLAAVQPSCGFSNGSIVSQISGGTSPYTYLWTPGGAATPNITAVAPGSYTLQVTDALNCVSTYSATLTDIPGPTVATAATTNVSCAGGNDGSATISITQGSAPFVINWAPYGGNGLTAGTLIAGTYTATVTDSLGCIATVSPVITEPAPLTVSISSVTNVACNGNSSGVINLSVTGGTSGYSYAWLPSGPNSPTLSNVGAGTYTATVTDQHNCVSSISIPVTQPTALSSSISSVTNPVCYSGTGSASVLVSGGTPPFSYSWSSNPIQTGSTMSNVPAGLYHVTVTDSNGCSLVDSATLVQPTQVITTAGPNDTICVGSSGIITASATGGAGNYQYAWQPTGATNQGTYSISPVVNTTYIVIAYDSLGCAGTPDTTNAILYVLNASSVQVSGYSPLCPGQSTSISVQTTGNTGPLTYSWNHGLGNTTGPFTVTPSQPTTYVVHVANNCGAMVVDSVQIVFSPPPTVSLLSDTNVVCVPNSIHFVSNSLTGYAPDPIHTWLWNFGDGTTSQLPNPLHLYTQPGTYSVTLSVTTGNGCTNNNASTPMIVNAYPTPVAAFGINSGTLNLPYDLLVCTNQSTGAVNYHWNFGDGNTSTSVNPQYMYNSIGNFNIQLIAMNQFGCADTAYNEVTTNTDVVFPNVFTPDPEGPSGGSYTIGSLTNDVFFPYTSGVTDFKMQIFDRWGELIFESTDINIGWDGYYRGKICQQDVYIWKASIKLNNGKIFNKSGDVTLLR